MTAGLVLVALLQCSSVAVLASSSARSNAGSGIIQKIKGVSLAKNNEMKFRVPIATTTAEGYYVGLRPKQEQERELSAASVPLAVIGEAWTSGGGMVRAAQVETGCVKQLRKSDEDGSGSSGSSSSKISGSKTGSGSGSGSTSGSDTKDSGPDTSSGSGSGSGSGSSSGSESDDSGSGSGSKGSKYSSDSDSDNDRNKKLCDEEELPSAQSVSVEYAYEPCTAVALETLVTDSTNVRTFRMGMGLVLEQEAAGNIDSVLREALQFNLAPPLTNCGDFARRRRLQEAESDGSRPENVVFGDMQVTSVRKFETILVD